MISKYSTHKTWAFVLERAFSCWYCRYFHRSQNLKKDLKGMSCVAFVLLKMMLLSHFWVIEEDRKVFSLLMFHCILCSPFSHRCFSQTCTEGGYMAQLAIWLFKSINWYYNTFMEKCQRHIKRIKSCRRDSGTQRTDLWLPRWKG